MPKVGDVVQFHFVPQHRCGGGDSSTCDCTSTAAVTRDAEVVTVFDPDDSGQALELEVAMTDEDLALGYATRQSSSYGAKQVPPESGAWTLSLLLALLSLICVASGCGRGPMIWNAWPVDEAVATGSTFTVHSSGGSGRAFHVGYDGTLVTDASVCMGAVDSIQIERRGLRYRATIAAPLGEGLCLIRASSTALADSHPMIVADRMPYLGGAVSHVAADGMRSRRAEITTPWRDGLAGSPAYDGCGVVGVVTGPRVSGHPGSQIVTLAALQRFLVASGVAYERQPLPPGDLDLGGHPWPDERAVSAMRLAPGTAPLTLEPEVLPEAIPHGGSGSCR